MNKINFSQRRDAMIESHIAGRGIQSQLVLEAMQAVPREVFLPEHLREFAYQDAPLPIAEGQTISQPYIVALMTEALALKGGEKVLEIGTGSGYQTAVLAALVKRVFTVERIAPLIERARDRFRALKLRNVRVKYDDGTMGWSEQGPFDGIIVTAAARSVPEALLEQLAVGGRMVIPVGDDNVQELKVIDRTEEGLREDRLEYVRFVPLLRGTVG